jgi:hypothetical protein
MALLPTANCHRASSARVSCERNGTPARTDVQENWLGVKHGRPVLVGEAPAGTAHH